MESNQTAKRNVNSLQNQGCGNVPSLGEDDGVNAKRFKEEPEPLEVGSENSLQNQDDGNVPSLMEAEGSSIESFQEYLNPLRIGTILEIIFSNLDVDSIKNARQVNPLWSIEGAKMLITKCYLKIPSNLQVQEVSSKSKEMDEFKAFLSHKSSDYSMTPNITIDKASDAELWKSLGVVGPQVESLNLNYIHVKGNRLMNLLDLLPNLKLLRFQPLEDLWVWTKVIENLHSVMSTAKEGRNPLIISSLCLKASNTKHLANIEKLSDCNNILIENLTWEAYSVDFRGVVNLGIRVSSFMHKLLSRNRNILKSLCLVDCTVILPLLEFPCMPALTALNLLFYKPGDALQPKKFSQSFRFSEKVPNLTHVFFTVLDRDEYSEDFFGQLLKHTGTAPSVKVLKLRHDVHEFNIDPLWSTFPNLEEYDTEGIQCSQKMVECLWKNGVNLRKLTITVWIDDRPLADLDSMFTGFTADTVDKIRETPNLDPYTLEELEQLRVNPSILNLKDLEHLTINFRHFNRTDVPQRFLATAGEYAFKLLPKEPTICIDFEFGNFEDEDVDHFMHEVSKLPNVTVFLPGVERWDESEDEMSGSSSDVDDEM